MPSTVSVNKGCCSHQDPAATPARVTPWGNSGWESTGYWPQIAEVPIKRTVIGKNQFWLHVGSISLNLAFAIHCFCQGTLPLCLNVKLKWVFFFSLQGDFLTLSTCGWSAETKTLINTLLFCKTNGLLTLLPHLLSFFFQKKKGTQTPIIWLFWDISLPSSQSANFPNKVAIPCLNTSSVSLTGPFVRWGEWAWTQ